MAKIKLANDVETGKPIELSLDEMGNVLIAGTPGSGKSIFLILIAKSLMSIYGSDEIGFIVHDEKGLDYRFLKDDSRLLLPMGRDLDDFSDQLAYLEQLVQADETGTPRPSNIVVIIDEFFFAHFDKRVMARLEALMKEGPKNHIYFFISAQCPIIYTKEMHKAAQTKLAFHLFEKDGEVFCGEENLRTLCPNSGDGLYVRNACDKEERTLVHVQYERKRG